MIVRLKRPWGQWSKGHVFTEMPGGQARVLIARGLAEEAKDDSLPLREKRYADRMLRSAASGEGVR